MSFVTSLTQLDDSDIPTCCGLQKLKGAQVHDPSFCTWIGIAPTGGCILTTGSKADMEIRGVSPGTASHRDHHMTLAGWPSPILMALNMAEGLRATREPQWKLLPKPLIVR